MTIALALVLLAGAPGADHAVLPPIFATAARDSAVAQDVVRRARSALSRAPAPIPRIHTEGTLPGRGIRDASIAAKRDHPIALDLALAWRLTGERAFLTQAERYLMAWADIYRPSFNPIDETGFDVLLLAYDLTETSLPPKARNRLDRFWRGMAVGYLDAMDGRPKNAHTNWQGHRIKLATLAAFQSGDARLVARARAAYRRHIAVNLHADGSTFDFEERDALHYVTYNLDPLMMATLAARAHGEDWFGWTAPSGASLPRSLEWLADYARGTRTHIEFQHSKIAFDRERAAAGQAGFAPHPWDPANAVNTYALAARLDPRFAALRDRLIARSGKAPPPWMMLADPDDRSTSRAVIDTQPRAPDRTTTASG